MENFTNGKLHYWTTEPVDKYTSDNCTSGQLNKSTIAHVDNGISGQLHKRITAQVDKCASVVIVL